MLHNRYGMFLYVWGMEANELRIGNWVNNPIDDVIQVTIIDILNIDHKESYDPIDISHDWLLKLGFKFGDMGIKMYTIKTDIGHFFIDEHFQPFLISGSIRKFKYVHELQNLYHILFGSELR